MPFFDFNQNNSGGRFVRTDDLDDNVIIEAPDKDAAIHRALSLGIYFNGCDEGQDCPCCGDRWSEPWKDEGTEVPEIYGKPVTDLSTNREPQTRDVVVHYADGSVKYGVKDGGFGLALHSDYEPSGKSRITVERQTRAEANARMLAGLPDDIRKRLED